MDPKIDEHRGRIVKNTGDGMLAEFASVVDAVRCAAEVQRAIADRNATSPTLSATKGSSGNKRAIWRIGIR
jgi:adenylate cyclase